MSRLQHHLLLFRKLLKNRKFLFVYVPLFLLMLALPLVIVVSQRKQQTSQYASASTNDLYVSNSGSDSNPCTQTAPCATIQHAASLTVAGTTVHVAAGTYNENINNGNSGTSTARITFVSEPLHAAKIQGTTSGASSSVFYNTGSYVTINGFDISDPAASDGIHDYGNHVVFSNNIVHNIGNNTCLSGGAISFGGNYNYYDIDIFDNIVHDNGPTSSCDQEHGIYISEPGNERVYNNISYNNSGYGIHCWHACGDGTGVVVLNNLVFSNRWGGMVFGDGDAPNFGSSQFNNSVVANNISVDNAGYGISEYEYSGQNTIGTNNQFLNNLVYGNSSGNFNLLNGNTAQNTVTADPTTIFVNWQANGTGDYHLKAGSPAIDAGTSLDAPATDFDGNTRPQGAGYDIGPYEYVTSSNCLASTTSWQNQTIPSQTGTFEATFDATPSMSGTASVIGLSQNAAATYTDLAAIIAFETTGVIDARNGGTYQAQNTVTYTAGATYHFRLDINVPSHTYSIYVTPPGSSEVTIGTNYAFRTEQSSATSLNYWSTLSTSGSVNVCNFAIGSIATPTNTPTPPNTPTPTATLTPTPVPGNVTIATPLALSSTALTLGQTLTGTVTYKNSGGTTVSLQNIVINLIPPGGTKTGGPWIAMQPTEGAITLQPSQTVTLTSSHTFSSTDPTGTWFSYATYQDTSGVWHDDSTNINFTVSATPTNTPTPLPTNTPTPIPSTPTPTPVLDTTPPAIVITSPQNGATVKHSSTVTITATDSDNVGVTQVQFLVNGTLLCSISNPSSPVNCNWPVPGKRGVTYTIVARAYDAAGNAASSSIKVQSQ